MSLYGPVMSLARTGAFVSLYGPVLVSLYGPGARVVVRTVIAFVSL
jgi:hypothetical protein